MIEITNRKHCTGCGACAQKCPKGAISMKADGADFTYPTIDNNSCIDCGMCQKICPVNQSTRQSGEIMTAYAAYALDDEIRMHSSSGGIFSVLGEYVLSNGGIVFGAAFDETHLVRQEAINSKEELDRLRGSKYLQSRTEDTFRAAEECLKAGRIVLYTGTACQIAGLKAFLGKDYPELFTVDVLCHGVPSPKLWQKYLSEQEKTHASYVQQTFFRQKNFGWKRYAVELLFSNSTAYLCEHRKDRYMQMFLGNICLRDSCHNCAFKGNNVCSDLTIGDSWGIQEYMKEMDDDRGTSVVFIRSKKGKELFSKVYEKLVVKQGNVQTFIRYNSAAVVSVKPHPNRKKFMRLLEQDAEMDVLYSALQISYPKKIYRYISRRVEKLWRLFKHKTPI